MYIFKSRYQQVILPESICPNCTHFLSSRTFLSTSCWNKLNKFTRDTFPGHWICFSVETMTSFYDLKAKKLTGEVVSMEEYKGKVVLVENTASLWGTTIRDFTQMNELCEKVKKRAWYQTPLHEKNTSKCCPLFDISVHLLIQRPTLAGGREISYISL